jgi:hypothetical protein
MLLVLTLLPFATQAPPGRLLLVPMLYRCLPGVQFSVVFNLQLRVLPLPPFLGGRSMASRPPNPLMIALGTGPFFPSVSGACPMVIAELHACNQYGVAHVSTGVMLLSIVVPLTRQCRNILLALVNGGDKLLIAVNPKRHLSAGLTARPLGRLRGARPFLARLVIWQRHFP